MRITRRQEPDLLSAIAIIEGLLIAMIEGRVVA
jgi:hypothetical protein